MEAFTDELSKRLSEFAPRKIDSSGKGEASVLMSLFYEGSDPAFLLTKRSERVATYRGHISFPGGMRDSADDSLVDTALREANEEIGIDTKHIKVLGEFNDYLANEGFVIHTVLGFLEDTSRLKPQPDEVEYLLKIPMSFFKENPPRTEIWERNGNSFEVYFYDYKGEVVWGLTARMIKHFVDHLV